MQIIMRKRIKIIVILIFILLVIAIGIYIFYYRNSSKAIFMINDKEIERCVPSFNIDYERENNIEYIGLYLPYLDKWCIPRATTPPFLGDSYIVLVIENKQYKEGLMKTGYGDDEFYDIDAQFNFDSSVLKNVTINTIDSSFNSFNHYINSINLSEAEQYNVKRYYNDMKEYRELYKDKEVDIKFGNWLEQKYKNINQIE